MFARKAQKVAVEPAVITIPVATRNLPTPAPADYIATCEAIGAHQLSALVKLTTILALEVGRIYNRDEVNRFLISQCPKGLQVTWKHLSGRSFTGTRSWRYEKVNPYSVEFVQVLGERKYDKMVPTSVLNLVGMIEKEAPGTFGYYVSDYAVPTPDPFLMVYQPDTDRDFVVAHWDEPNWK